MAAMLGVEIEDFLALDADEIGVLLVPRIRGDRAVSVWNTILAVQQEARNAGVDESLVKLVGQRIAEGWQWLRNQGLVARSHEQSGDGWEYPTRAAQTLDVATYLQEARSTALIRQADLDPELREKVLPLFRRGQFEDAVFAAFRLVEVRVREASGQDADLVGVHLMRKAYRPGGPLADAELAEGEQEGYMHLFSGAIAVLKNPPSHRTVRYDNPNEAAEAVLLANLLLRFVARSSSISAP